ncbi:hypothetical protein T03_12096 [Trichinella britovi]|uniref:Uncharacterized protein n=1 Tax=Trichinella britovi TaxID=45882 RepID=A0A0V1DCY9_TRIBR|nr:hypothetical protein T03_12096 [Trichinella britovi]KRZ90597.1 hypothetical protein T08_3982 [Trichinella sp. T8]
MQIRITVAQLNKNAASRYDDCATILFVRLCCGCQDEWIESCQSFSFVSIRLKPILLPFSNFIYKLLRKRINISQRPTTQADSCRMA